MGVPSQQDPHEVSKLIKALEAAKGNRRGGGSREKFSCKKNTYSIPNSSITVDSWKFNDWDYSKADLPTYARGLFTSKRSDNKPEIVIRGYDKFFNVNELRVTEWDNIEKNTVGPYELSVKENGCILFMSGLEDGTLLVCSKHSTGARADAEKSHAIIGERWIERHLAGVGRTKRELANYLRANNITAVGELCDDAFEEHVLAYPPEMAGVYIHGINLNLPEFATWSGPKVHEFAVDWGFKKAEYTMIQDIGEVRQFLEKCAETGSWDGRDTEGFVVRCYLKGKSGQPESNWFFKFKFEEPYLMYRQWRECTKAVIAGRPPKIRKHKQVTEEYLLYARRQFAKDPQLTKLYNQNHGIIAMREGFLVEKGVKGSDIIAAEADQESGEDAISRNVVLIPVATIGCGKTTVAAALVRLFGFGHVQNDNIQGPKNRAGRFALQVTSNMVSFPAVIADRNNHQKREREQLIHDIQKVVPEAVFIALQYVHEPKEKMVPQIRKITARRVLDRGDNHQTLHAITKGEQEILGIMDGFLDRFQPIDTNREPDANFEDVINLDVAASSRENLETVITYLYNSYPKLFVDEMPTHQDMDDAIAYAMENQVDLKHDLSHGARDNNRRKDREVTQVPPPEKELTTEQLVKRLEYFSIPISTTVINSLLGNLFAHVPTEQAQMYQRLKQDDRIQDTFHVTLIHRASATAQPESWQHYINVLDERMSKANGKKTRDNIPSLGPARIRLERLVWDDRVMAIVASIVPADNGFAWPCANAVPHITVGTAHPSIKPKESNDLLARWVAGQQQESKIWEMEVPGYKIIEGAVKPILQRNR